MSQKSSTQTEEIEDKKTSWLELFFDLAYVWAIAQLTYLAGSHHSGIEIFAFIIIFIMLFQTWWMTSINRNLDETEELWLKLVLQLQMFFIMIMSIFLWNIFDGGIYGFLIWFVAARAISVWLLVHMYIKNPSIRPKSYHILQWMIISLLGFALTWLVQWEYIFYLWALLVIFDLFIPLITSRHKHKKNTIIKTNPAHLQERLGLFVLLVLWESILVVAIISWLWKVIQTTQWWVVGVLWFVSICSMWWLYFSYLDGIMHGKRYKKLIQFMYAHIVLFISMITFAIGVKQLLKDLFHSWNNDLNLFVVIAIALFILAYHWIKFSMWHSLSRCAKSTSKVALLFIIFFGIIRYISDSQLIELAILTLLFVCYTYFENRKLKYIK